MRVLIVEDSALMRKKIGDVLEAQGIDCEYADNGSEAIRLCLGRAYDVIVTDLSMPVLDGFRFMARIRAGGKNAGTPVIVVTARADRQTVVEAKRLGIRAFLLKPVTPEILLGEVGLAAADVGARPVRPASSPTGDLSVPIAPGGAADLPG